MEFTDKNRSIAEEHFMDWLRDAHAMELQAETMLKATASRIEHYPDVKARVELHIAETQGQAKQIAACIERRGGDTSTIKDIGGKAMATAQGVTGMFASDEVVKSGLFSYAFEHMEIASYRSLIAAARTLGDEATAQVCEKILKEEEAMATWLADHIQPLTMQFLQRAATGAEAKR